MYPRFVQDATAAMNNATFAWGAQQSYIYIPVNLVLGCPFRCSAACAAEAKARFKPELTMSMQKEIQHLSYTYAYIYMYMSSPLHAAGFVQLQRSMPP